MAKNTAKNGLILEDISITLYGKLMISLEGQRQVSPGEWLCIMGSSGVGKSTLINYICADLHPPFQGSGKVLLNGRNLRDFPPWQRQAWCDLSGRSSVSAFIGGGEYYAGPSAWFKARPCDRRRRRQILCGQDLKALWDKDPATLSGGQRARVAILRTLWAGPEALLMDEPFTGLDQARKDDFYGFIVERIRDLETPPPVLLVSHDPGDAELSGAPVLELAPGHRRE